MKQHSGGCHCGAVRYQTTAALRPVIICHCRDCMKIIGNSIAATSAPEAEVEITQTSLKWYRSSEIAERGFCGQCGASLFYRPSGTGRLAITAGTLDDPSDLECVGQIYAGAHPGFCPLPEGIEDIDDLYNKGEQGPEGKTNRW